LSLNFYKDLFATLCFISFSFALATKRAELFLAALIFGALSTSAHRRRWEDPIWARLYMERFNAWLDDLFDRHNQKTEFKDEEKINPLPPLDDDRDRRL